MTAITDFTTSFTVDRDAQEVFAVITDVRRWWHGEIEGVTDAVGEEFTYRQQDLHWSRQAVVELVPGERVVWRVTDARLSFTGDPAEWVGTEVVFALSEADGGTQVRFTHVGLVPALECFEACSGGWRHYVDGSLRSVLGGRRAGVEGAAVG